MNKPKFDFRKLSINTAGVVILIFGIIALPLPFPFQGTPIVLFGLSLLAINNPKAARFQEYLLKNYSSLSKLFFPENKWIQLAWDFVSIVLLALSAWCLFQLDLNILGKIIVSGFLGVGLFSFLGNRSRSDRIGSWWQSKFKKK